MKPHIPPIELGDSFTELPSDALAEEVFNLLVADMLPEYRKVGGFLAQTLQGTEATLPGSDGGMHTMRVVSLPVFAGVEQDGKHHLEPSADYFVMAVQHQPTPEVWDEAISSRWKTYFRVVVDTAVTEGDREGVAYMLFAGDSAEALTDSEITHAQFVIAAFRNAKIQALPFADAFAHAEDQRRMTLPLETVIIDGAERNTVPFDLDLFTDLEQCEAEDCAGHVICGHMTNIIN